LNIRVILKKDCEEANNMNISITKELQTKIKNSIEEGFENKDYMDFYLDETNTKIKIRVSKTNNGLMPIKTISYNGITYFVGIPE